MKFSARVLTTCCLLTLGLPAAGVMADEPAAGVGYRYTDAHLHYLDFFQDSEGMAALMAAMDEASIDHVVLMGMPLAKKWHENEPKRPRYYLGDDAPMYWYSATDAILAEAVRALAPAERRRVHPFLSGFNPNDKYADRHIERMIGMYPDLWQGIGEIMTRHDHLSSLVQGEVPRANSEAMMRVYRLAAKYDLPVLVHSNITSLREREPIYLTKMVEALEKNPRTRFVWAHAGTSGNINRWQARMPQLDDVIDDLLRRHDNLWIDLSWSVLEPHILDRDDDPRSAWLELVGRYPDRFVLGSDLVGHFDSLKPALARFQPLLDALSGDQARKLARDNMLALLPARPARLDADDATELRPEGPALRP